MVTHEPRYLIWFRYPTHDFRSKIGRGDRTLTTVGVLLEVASAVYEVINFWSSCSWVIWADVVFSLPFVAMPIFAAIVRVWEEAVTKLLAVRHGSTVWRGCWRCLRWLSGAHCLVVAWP